MFSLVTSKLYALPNDWCRVLYSGKIYSPITGMYQVLAAIIGDNFLRFVVTGLAKLYSMKHTGLTHYGLGEADMSSINFFVVYGRLRQTFKTQIEMIGDIIFYMEKGCPVIGGIYTPNGFNYWLNNSFCLAIHNTGYNLSSRLQQDAMKVLKCFSVLENRVDTAYRAISNLRTTFEYNISTKGILLLDSSFAHRVKGFCLANSRTAYLSASNLIASAKNYVKVRGGIGEKFDSIVKVKSAIWGNKSIPQKVTGNLSNNHGSWFIRAKGTVELIAKAFAFAVPKLNQQFHTEKRWFGKTAAKKEKK